MVPADSSPLLLYGGGGDSGGHQRRVSGGCRGDLGGGFSERFSFMRLLQQVHDFSAVSHDDDDNNNEDARLGSDSNNNDNNKVKNHNHHQDCRSNYKNNHNSNLMADREEPRTSGSSSKDNNTNTNTNTETDLSKAKMREEGWLRLGIGGQTEAKPDEKTNLDHRNGDRIDLTAARTTTTDSSSLLELNLFMGGTSAGTFSNPQEAQLRPPLLSPLANTTSLGSSSLFHNYHHHHHHHQESSSSSGAAKNIIIPGFHQHHEEMIGSWTFRPPFVPQNLSSPSPNLMMPLMGQYLARPQFHQSQLIGTSSNYSDVMAMAAAAAGPSSGNFRVIDPPRRPHSGVWFVLQASPNQAKEPFLPQIPKSYLRIKDGRMTVRLLMKYLVNKLQLQHESEVEIRCRGEQLQPALTLQHVRDSIWRRRRDTSSSSSSSLSLPLLPNSSTSDHLMVLHYGRSLL